MQIIDEEMAAKGDCLTILLMISFVNSTVSDCLGQDVF